MRMAKLVPYVSLLALGWLSLTLHLAAHAGEAAANTIEQVEFATLPGDKLNIRIKLGQPMANPPAGFTMTNPARIALDFPNTVSRLDKNALTVNQGPLRSLNIAQARNRTRLVLNLTQPSSYTARIDGNVVSVDLQLAAAGTDATASVTHFAEAAVVDTQRHRVHNVDFMRGKGGEGRVVVELSDSATGIGIRQQGQKIQVDFRNAELPENLERRLNVIDFATPVLTVDTMQVGKNVRMTIESHGLWEYSAYQADRKFVIDVRPLVEDPSKLVPGTKEGYKGEKLSLNFQDVEVRSLLQVIADFTGFNIIASDSVTGRITLRLKDVPWDQALDLILQTRGLGMRKSGNIIWIAPNEELAAKEKSRLDALREIEERQPLITQSFLIKYQLAEDIRTLLVGRAVGAVGTYRLLSDRGSVTVDKVTNTLFVQDTEKVLARVQEVINQIDVPARQVLIESRIVIATEGFGKALGARLGLAKGVTSGSGTVAIGNTAESAEALAFRRGRLTDADGGMSVNLPAALAAPLAGATPGTLGLTLLNRATGILLNLELSAAEADRKTKTVSSPRVITGNLQKAIVESGVEIPYQEATAAGATAVSFKKATVGLEVTPQITPDNKINMDILVKKDSKGETTAGVPAINTNRVQTKVLVDNGETAVLGGIFEEGNENSLDKVPFLGDLPVLGHLFKRTVNVTNRNELLIFLTPKLIDDQLRIDR